MTPLRRMLHFARPYRASSVLAMVLLVGMVAADLLIPRLTQRVIDDGIAPGDAHLILTTSLAMLGAALISALFAVANTVLSVRVGQNMGADLRSALVRKVQSYSPGNLDRIQTGQLLVRSTSDVNRVQMIVMMALRILTRAPLWMLGSIVMLVWTSPRLSLMMVLLAPVIIGMTWFFASRARPLSMALQQRLDGLNQVMQENLAGVRVVKAFVRADHEVARFDRANVALTDQTIALMKLMALLMPTMSFVMNLGIIGIIGFGGRLVVGGQLTEGEIVASFNYLSFSLFPMLMLGMMVGPLSAAAASAERIAEVLDSEPDVPDRPRVEGLPDARGRVDFQGVGFSYGGQDGGEQVLRDIDLVVEAGQKVAILGATGSGKSTLVHLIPRFYDVTRGRVLLDGVDLRDLPLAWLRAQVGIALQEAVLFSGSIRDNIAFGRPDAADDEVVAAARAAQAHDFIVSLPDGYDAVVGQRGVTLSGGQKQRISIARALLVQPRILILDDSTSAVDVETETRIRAALDERLTGHTRLVVAQRISTVLDADRIVVLERGRVAAVGTHEELLQTSPIYQEIYRSQLGEGEVPRGR